MNTLTKAEESAPPAGWALWALGFRPFYLLAALLAALSIPLWALQATGLLEHAYLRGPAWHAHEMLFGFALAVIVAFLLTAAWALWRALWAGRNRRNYFFVGLLVAVALAAALFHAVQMGAIALPGTLGLTVGLDIVLLIIVVMGGRVIPMFTNNGVPGAGARSRREVERLAIGSVIALLAVDLLLGITGGALPALIALIAFVAAIAHSVRWALWRPWHTRRTPLVWSLHLAYAWIWLHLLLRAMAAPGWVAASPTIHALTVGAIGGMTIAMMTRTARGHTARPLRADRFDVAAYLLVAAAALVRVALPLFWPATQVSAILGSALLWSAGYAVYVLRYGPWLLRPRLDGRPG